MLEVAPECGIAVVRSESVAYLPRPEGAICGPVHNQEIVGDAG